MMPFIFSVDRWLDNMDELYTAISVDVYSGRWRRQLQRAVAWGQGGTCLQLLQLIGLLKE